MASSVDAGGGAGRSGEVPFLSSTCSDPLPTTEATNRSAPRWRSSLSWFRPWASEIILRSFQDPRADVTGPLPSPLRTIRLEDLEELLYIHARFLTPQAPGVVEAEIIGAQEGDLGNVVFATKEPHHFYPRDKVQFAGCYESALGGQLHEVVHVCGQRTFQVKWPSGHEPPLPHTGLGPQLGATARTELNMHKLTPEVVIPATTVAENVVELKSEDDIEELRKALGYPDKDSSNLVLCQPLTLGSTDLPKGAAVHGRLVKGGHVRWKYWASGDDRGSWWMTTRRHGRRQRRADRVPKGYAEQQAFVKFGDLEVGNLIVIREGVSYAEIKTEFGNPVDDFVSHDWAEPSFKLLKTLRRARAKRCWICTFAVNQHDVSLPPKLEDSPFYTALKSLKRSRGRVTMCLDKRASALTRVWCIYEVWVAASLGLPFRMCTEHGELGLGTDTDTMSDIMDVIDGLSLESARATRDEDTNRIKKAIGDSQVQMRDVEWKVKRHLSMSTILEVSGLMTDTSATLFALPYIWGVTSLYLALVLNAGHELQLEIAVIVIYASFMWQGWDWLSTCLLGAGRCRRFCRALCYARGSDLVFIMLCLVEILVVVLLACAVVKDTYDDGTGFYEYLTVHEKKSKTVCWLVTCYVCLKVAPFMLVNLTFLASCGRYALAAAAFRPAAPRIGFCITVGAFCSEAWLSNYSRDALPVGTLRWAIFAGLWAWGASVIWATVHSFVTFLIPRSDSSEASHAGYDGSCAGSHEPPPTQRARKCHERRTVWRIALFVFVLLALLGQAGFYWLCQPSLDILVPLACVSGFLVWAFAASWGRVTASMIDAFKSWQRRPTREDAGVGSSRVEHVELEPAAADLRLTRSF